MRREIPYRLRLEIPRLPPLQAAGTTGGHWAKRVREKVWWDSQIGWHVRAGGRPAVPLPMANVTMTRHSTMEPDADNLAASWKYPLDALVKAGVIESDKPSVIEFISRWAKAKRASQGVTIEVRSLAKVAEGEPKAEAAVLESVPGHGA